MDSLLVNGNTKLHMNCLYNKEKAVIKQLKSGYQAFLVQNNDGDTPLHILAKYNHHSLLKTVAKALCTNLDSLNRDNNTVLTLSINDPEMIEFLIYNGCSNYNVVNGDGETIVTKVIEKIKHNSRYYDVLIKLLETGKIDFRIPKECPPLLLATYYNLDDVVLALLKFGADPNITSTTYSTPAILAVEKNSESLLKLLLNSNNSKYKYKIDLNFQGVDGRLNLLMIAAIHGYLNIVKLLLKSGADPNQHNRFRDTPLHTVLQIDNVSPTIISELLWRTDLNKRNIYGKTVLNLLSENHDTSHYNKIVEARMKDVRINKNKNTIKSKVYSKNYGLFNSDTLSSMIYTMLLLKKHKNLMIPHQPLDEKKLKNDKLQLSMSLYKTQQSKKITSLINMYTNDFYEIRPYLIVWLDKDNWFVDRQFDTYVKKCMKDKKIEYVYVKLTLILSDTAVHANVLLIDKKRNSCERFDPYGSIPFPDLDSTMSKLFEQFNLCYKSPADYMDGLSFQSFSNDSLVQFKKLGDPAGYCLAWCIWYINERIVNFKTEPKQLVKQFVDTLIASTPNSSNKFIDFIRDYAHKLDEEKNLYLESASISKDSFYDLIRTKEDTDLILNKLKTDLHSLV